MSDFSPRSAQFEERVRASFAKQSAMRSLGITLESISAGTIELILPYHSDFTQQHGFMHAGVLTTALDSACEYAAFSLMPESAEVLTVEFKTTLFAPAQGDYFVIRASVKKPGTTLFFTEAEAFAVFEGEEKKVAAMSATMMAVTR